MKIYIPSRGRFTANEISRGPLAIMPERWVNNTMVVVPYTEREAYTESIADLMSAQIVKGIPIIEAWTYDGIAQKRTMIGHHAEAHGFNKFMMLDDDINFLKRVSPEQVNQVTIRDSADINEMLCYVNMYLDLYPQVAVGMREGNNRSGVGPAPLLTKVTKAIRAVGYRTAIFRAVATDRVRTMSDYDTTLQILELGYENAVLNYWMSGQKGTNTPGGCSTWRTHAIHEESVRKMVELHPGIVYARVKENKTGGDFGVRMEATIGWKKAYQQGVHNHGAKTVC